QRLVVDARQRPCQRQRLGELGGDVATPGRQFGFGRPDALNKVAQRDLDEVVERLTGPPDVEPCARVTQFAVRSSRPSGASMPPAVCHCPRITRVVASSTAARNGTRAWPTATALTRSVSKRCLNADELMSRTSLLASANRPGTSSSASAGHAVYLSM